MKNIVTRSFLFAAAESATAAAGPVVEKTPTQFTVNVSKDDKAFVADVVKEFDLKNTMEAIAILRTVAEGSRFYRAQAMEIVEIDGGSMEQPAFDEDGQPIMETRCRWEDAANEIAANRSAVKVDKTREKLIAKLAALGVDVSKL